MKTIEAKTEAKIVTKRLATSQETMNSTTSHNVITAVPTANRLSSSADEPDQAIVPPILQQAIDHGPVGFWNSPAIIASNNFVYKSLSEWAFNTAIGCSHACRFCYVPHTSTNKQGPKLADYGVKDTDAEWGDYVLLRPFDEKKFLKSLETAEATPREDLKADGNRAVLYCSTTDPYQVIRHPDATRQRELGEHARFLVRRSLELIRDRSTLNVRILTRSPLAREDFDLFRSFGERLVFGMSLPTLRNDLAKVYEPKAPAPSQRLKTLRAAADAGLHVYVAVAPTYPECDETDLRATLAAVADLKPITIFHEPINIRAENVARIEAEAARLGVVLQTDVFANLASSQNYAVESLKTVERVAGELGIADRLHLWPDKLLGTVDAKRQIAQRRGETVADFELWLNRWWDRISEWPAAAQAEVIDGGAVYRTESKLRASGNGRPPFQSMNHQQIKNLGPVLTTEAIESCAVTCKGHQDDVRVFPLVALPDTIRPYVERVSTANRTPAGLAACCVLGTLSAAIGKGLRVQSIPNKTTPANLYILAGAPSGIGKSLVFADVTEPLRDYERTAGGLADAEAQAGREHRQGLEAANRNLQLRLDDPTITAEQRQQVQSEINENQQALRVLPGNGPTPQLVCEDTTPAALVKILAANDECVASFSPDARDITNRLVGSNPNNTATFEGIFLKAYSHETHNVDRGGKRDPIHLKAPALTCLWLIQPDLMQKMYGTTKLTEGGLLPRFLVHSVDCEPKKIDRDRQLMPPAVNEGWRTLVTTVMDAYRFADDARIVEVDTDARRAMDKQHDGLVDRRQSDLIDVNTYVSRWNENAWRLALVLHVAKHGATAHEHQLDSETAEGAIAIVDWFAGEQLDILAASREESYLKASNRVKELFPKNAGGITTRIVHRARVTATAANAKALLERMRQEGILRYQEIQPEGGGKVSEVYSLAE